MYSIVLMAALTAGADAPSCWWSHGSCHGCSGYSCHGGYSCSGCHGYSYGGCGGGYSYGCSGCYGCYGSYGYGCYGSGYGGCWGVSPYAGLMTPVAPMAPAAPAAPPAAAPVAPAAKPDAEKKPGEAAANSAGKLIVELPVDAQLYIDGQLMRTNSVRRVFNTPVLDKGQAYYYDVKAEIVIDGQTHVENGRVIVRAGETSQMTFAKLLALADPSKPKAVAAAR